MRQGSMLRDIRDFLADAGVSVPLARLQGLFGKTPKPETVLDGGETEPDTARPNDAGKKGKREARTRNDAKETA